MINRNIVFFLGLIFPCFSLVTDTRAVTTGDFRSYSTSYSIGIEWDISGDADHNTGCTVQYRPAGHSLWKNGQSLYRVDFNGADMMAGSILFLEPGTNYEINLQLSDPDGSSEIKNFFITTEKVPELPQGGRTFYVVPGVGGGAGTQDDPYQGIASAQANALPGDIFLLGKGNYPGEIEFNVSGAVDNHVVWKAWGNGAPVLETVWINGDYIWLQGLQIQGNSYGIRTYNNPRNVVVSQNTFIGCHYCVYLNHGGTGWYIADNVIVGDVEPASGDFGGEGVELNHTDNHTVAYNSISHVADGVSYPGTNCDVFANDIFDVSDDGIEPDYGYANNRVWGNRISNAYHNGISFQPMNGAPWYIIRNQVAAPVENALKFRDRVDRALIAHNTFIGWQGAQKTGSGFLINVHSNNNLYISMTDWYAWENGSGGAVNWKTNLDYDGFDWGGYPYAFKWVDRYVDLPEFTAATGLEPHGIRIDKDTCFETFNIPSAPPASMPKQYITLKPDCNAVDYGVVLPNIDDDFLGLKPDLGAYEVGAVLPHFGPRTETTNDRGMLPLFLPALINREN